MHQRNVSWCSSFTFGLVSTEMSLEFCKNVVTERVTPDDPARALMGIFIPDFRVICVFMERYDLSIILI